MFVDIQCPACEDGVIKVEPRLLAQGASFSCGNCKARIAVATDSRSEVAKTIDAYDEYRKKMAALQEQGNNPEQM